jgi:hypothetical protein
MVFWSKLKRYLSEKDKKIRVSVRKRQLKILGFSRFIGSAKPMDPIAYSLHNSEAPNTVWMAGVFIGGTVPIFNFPMARSRRGERGENNA